MSDEQVFLQAIEKSRRDDATRLIYADWLEEAGETHKSQYLRLEKQIRDSWTYADQQLELQQQISALRPHLDLQWLSRVRCVTTPPPPFDVEKVVSSLKGRAKPAWLLHTRRGETTRHASKVGGLFLWPAKEPWPTCPEHNDCPFAPALQLRKKDVPRIVKFKGTSDLMQVLWCPFDHEPSYCVAPKIYWRREKSVKEPIEDYPRGEGESWYIPKPCVVIPERVKEYPDSAELPGNGYAQITSDLFLQQANKIKLAPIGNWGVYHDEGAYQCYLSNSQCTKVGGYPSWVQHPGGPDCSQCGAAMEHLLSFGSWEYDGGMWGRWLPIEDRDLLEHRSTEDPAAAPDWMFGDAGQLYVFVCRKCKDWPIRSFMQCS